MKINNDGSSGSIDRLNRAKTEKGQTTAVRGGKESTPLRIGDSVRDPAAVTTNVSDRAKTMAKARSVIDATPDVDMEKVERIKQALITGSYDIDYDKLAEKLVREDLLNQIL